MVDLLVCSYMSILSQSKITAHPYCWCSVQWCTLELWWCSHLRAVVLAELVADDGAHRVQLLGLDTALAPAQGVVKQHLNIVLTRHVCGVQRCSESESCTLPPEHRHGLHVWSGDTHSAGLATQAPLTAVCRVQVSSWQSSTYLSPATPWHVNNVPGIRSIENLYLPLGSCILLFFRPMQID